MNGRQTIQVAEVGPATRLPREQFPDAVLEVLARNYEPQVSIDVPSFKTDGCWELSGRGWVGYIPVTPEIGIALRPKVAIGNLFRMLEYAYRLKSFRFIDDLMDCGTLEEFYERLANILARRILDRGRKGFYRAYLPEDERLPYVRGRVDLRRTMQSRWDPNLLCHYEEHTADIEDNQILSWTLSCIARSGLCTERVLPTVRHAFRAVDSFATPSHTDASRCAGRLYNRLNDDYQPMHALCRFFLERTGPTHQYGDRSTVPFLVDMPRLYELFVAEWLKTHPIEGLVLTAQETVPISSTLSFDIDLVLYDSVTEAPRFVMDTKYKDSPQPTTEDVAQVVAYAEAKGCREAILVYPSALSQPLDAMIGAIRVRTLTFALDGDLEKAGNAFLADLPGMATT